MASSLRARGWPRLALLQRFGAALWPAALLVCAALGPAALHEALAAAAGTLFEAAPFVLAAELMPARASALARLCGCGCPVSGAGPISLPATALCWVAFGPQLALGRTLLAVAAQRLGSRRSDVRPCHDALAELVTLAPCAAAAALGAGALSALPALGPRPVGESGAFLAGAALGALAPCATAAVAIAASLAAHLPAASAGMLLTGGLARFGLLGRAGADAHTATVPRAGPVLTRLAVAAALTLLVLRGPGGFVNPRMFPLTVAGIGLGLLGAYRAAVHHVSRPGTDHWIVPGLMLSGLLAGSPLPRGTAVATALGDAYPGERLAFVGTLQRSDRGSVLERFVITCCRADATAIAVRTTAAIPRREGTWVAAQGTLVQDRDGLALRVARWRVVPRPHDPFLYR